MYLIETLALLCIAYIAPALAVWPRALTKPEYAISIPIISSAAILLIHTVLVTIDHFSTFSVRLIATFYIAIAIYRVYRARHLNTAIFSGWSKQHFLILMAALALCIYIVARLMVYGFDNDDEIYSWNLWALQHVFGEKIDLYYTNAPYPQLFPKILAYCYQLLGSIETQTAVKSALIIFPLSLLFCIGLAVGRYTSKLFALYAILLLFILEGVGLRRVFDDGMPDTMTATSVAIAVFYLLKFRQRPEQTKLLVLSVTCASVGAISKQPALLFALFSLPAIIVLDSIRTKLNYKHIAISFVPACISLAWFFTEGNHFHENNGVLDASMANRALLEQLSHSFSVHFLDHIPLLFLLAVTIYCVMANKKGISVLLLFIVPSIAAWLVWAAYDIRAGIPAIAAMALLITYNTFGIRAKERAHTARPTDTNPTQGTTYYITIAILLIAAFAGSYATFHKAHTGHNGYVAGNTKQNNFFRIFGDEATVVYEKIRANPNNHIWASNNYIYGLFYGYTRTSRPNRLHGYDTQSLIAEILEKSRPLYLMEE